MKDNDLYVYVPPVNGHWTILDSNTTVSNMESKILKKRFHTMEMDDVHIPCTYIIFCYLTTKDGVAKGISITSEDDKYDMVRGRDIALGRAKKALREHRSGNLIKKPEYYGLRKYGIDCLYSWVGT